MTNVNVKVGKMPGQINEYALEVGATVRQALELAGLESTGFEIRVSGAVADENKVLNNGDIVLLVQKIKGNMPVVKAGKMPGQIQEYAVEEGATVADVLALADLDSTGYEIRVSGSTATPDTTVTEGSIVLLVQKIKGNMPIVKVGKMPGQINEYALADGATVADALEEADLDPTGFEIRVSGSTSDGARVLAENDIVLLVQKIKGNK